MDLQSGFFTSVDGDRLYDESDFSRYLEGIIQNGCFPIETGFKVLPNPAPIGSDPPSVILTAGKAYMNGDWAYLPQNTVYTIGTEQLIVPGQKHLIYMCFDRTLDANGRVARIEHVTGVAPVIPADAGGRYYMPLAMLTDLMANQPTVDSDLRWHAGASALPTIDSVGPEHIKDKAVGTVALDDDAVTLAKTKDEASTLLTVTTTTAATLNNGDTRYSAETGNYTSVNGEMLGVMWQADFKTPGPTRRVQTFLQCSRDDGAWTNVPGTSQKHPAPEQLLFYGHCGSAFVKTNPGERIKFRVGITAITSSIQDTTLAVHSVHAFM